MNNIMVNNQLFSRFLIILIIKFKNYIYQLNLKKKIELKKKIKIQKYKLC